MKTALSQLCIMALLCGPCFAAESPAKPATVAAPKVAVKAAKATNPEPTLANVAYGTHERQVLDFWKAESTQPTPLLFYHPRRRLGGGRQGARQRRRQVPRGRHLGRLDQLPLRHPGDRRGREAAGRSGRCTTPRGRCSSSAARPPSGTSTRAGSARRAARPAPVRACGWRFTTTWPTRRAATRSPASRRGCGARP